MQFPINLAGTTRTLGRSPYSLFRRLENEHSPRLWDLIWCWKGPHRIHTFLWLAAHERLLTNELRARRGLTTNHDCPHCIGSPETALHVFRDCTLARAMWTDLLHLAQSSQFFTTPTIADWFRTNLKESTASYATMDWCLVFGTGCWLLWSWRNRELFNPEFHRPPNEASIVRTTAEGFHQAWEFGSSIDRVPTRIKRNIVWSKLSLYII